MRQSRMSLVLVLLTIALGLLAGCRSNPSVDLGAQARSPLPDVPVADGFELVELRSRSWQSGQSRFVDHMYEGSGDKFAVSRFYEKQMPIAGWSMESSQFLQGRGTMDFIKGQERCRITYYDKSLGGTVVLVAIWPTEQGELLRPAADQ